MIFLNYTHVQADTVQIIKIHDKISLINDISVKCVFAKT